ncbi:hypothetical protein GCM10009682_62140 [Luedemannella flava]|uniref:Secreted protein n=1 Tax=Luedemannella flava TaxID=349316 RepID=A0ABP4Z2Q1_9ACTN
MPYTLRRLTPRLIAIATGLAVVAGTGYAVANADTGPSKQVAAPSVDTRTTLPKPAAAGPGDAPIGGEVPGRTGSAIRATAGAQAAHRARSLARAGKSAPDADASASAAAAAQEHPAAGTYFTKLATSTGIRATHSVFYGSGDTTRTGDVVYAPTLMPPSSACIEITTAYTWDAPVVWAWDWCSSNSGVAKEIPINATFVRTYTTQVNGLPAYSVIIQKTNTANNTWTAYLYNYARGAWDTFWTKSGTSQIGVRGWDVFEPYLTRNPSTGLGYYCATMKGRAFETTGIQVRVNGVYTNASSTVGASYYPTMDLGCGSRLKWTQTNLTSWRATIS